MEQGENARQLTISVSFFFPVHGISPSESTTAREISCLFSFAFSSPVTFRIFRYKKADESLCVCTYGNSSWQQQYQCEDQVRRKRRVLGIISLINRGYDAGRSIS